MNNTSFIKRSFCFSCKWKEYLITFVCSEPNQNKIIKEIDYITGIHTYNIKCYDINKNGKCENYLPKNFNKRLDHLLEKSKNNLEQDLKDIILKTKLKFFHTYYPNGLYLLLKFQRGYIVNKVEEMQDFIYQLGINEY